MIFKAKKKLYTHIGPAYIQVQHLGENQRDWGYLATIEKLKAWKEVKETAPVIKSCQKTFAETKTAVTYYSICMEQTNFITSKSNHQLHFKRGGSAPAL